MTYTQWGKSRISKQGTRISKQSSHWGKRRSWRWCDVQSSSAHS